MTPSRQELKVSVFSDYICPFCYIGSRRLLRLRELYDLRVNWCGVEIHPETPAEGMPIEHLGYPSGQWRRMMASLQSMADEEGIALGPHGFTTRSRDALLLAEAAKRIGRETFYALHEALFYALFGEGRNIGDRRVLEELATEAGLTPAQVASAWSDPRYVRNLAIYRQMAARVPVRGTPTFIFGEEVVAGVVPYARLAEAAARLDGAAGRES